MQKKKNLIKEGGGGGVNRLVQKGVYVYRLPHCCFQVCVKLVYALCLDNKIRRSRSETPT